MGELKGLNVISQNFSGAVLIPHQNRHLRICAAPLQPVGDGLVRKKDGDPVVTGSDMVRIIYDLLLFRCLMYGSLRT
jgi:hypothetical protein